MLMGYEGPVTQNPGVVPNPASPKPLASDYFGEENFILENWEPVL